LVDAGRRLIFSGGHYLLVDENRPTHFMVLLFGASGKYLSSKACHVGMFGTAVFLFR
jgi:hypothetical protein